MQIRHCTIFYDCYNPNNCILKKLELQKFMNTTLNLFGFPTLFATIISCGICMEDFSLEFKNHQEIKSSLINSSIESVMQEIEGVRNDENGNKRVAYVVKLKDGTEAIFKKRPYDSLFAEVMTYEMAYQLFGLQHTLPPTVPKKYGFE